MTNNILSTEHTTEASDTVYDVELEELGRSDRSDLRSAIHATYLPPCSLLPERIIDGIMINSTICL
jgi:hypothetical protein